MVPAQSTPVSLRHWARVTLASLRVMAGMMFYCLSGRTPAFAYQGMVRLFVLTRGRSNDMLAAWIGRWRRPYPLALADGILNLRSESERKAVADALRTKGYYLFPEQLPAELCDKLLQLALTQPCTARAQDGGGGAPAPATPYPRGDPQAIIYDFHPGDLINQPDVQRLMGDASFLTVAQDYLGAQPVLDTVNMWWSTAHSQQPDGNAAQLYHFDMDHVRWLKFFIYLTDMTPATGPHCFVAGSHRSGGITDSVLSQGYARLTDAEVAASYPAQALMEFTGRRGTVIAEDTRGLHKGKPVLEGDRLMFEFEFSNSLFGAVVSGKGAIRKYHDSAFRCFVAAHRRVFSRWLDAGTPR